MPPLSHNTYELIKLSNYRATTRICLLASQTPLTSPAQYISSSTSFSQTLKKAVLAFCVLSCVFFVLEH